MGDEAGGLHLRSFVSQPQLIGCTACGNFSAGCEAEIQGCDSPAAPGMGRLAGCPERLPPRLVWLSRSLRSSEPFASIHYYGTPRSDQLVTSPPNIPVEMSPAAYVSVFGALDSLTIIGSLVPLRQVSR